MDMSEKAEEESPGKIQADSLSAEASTEAGQEQPEQFPDEPDEDALLLENIKRVRDRARAGGLFSSARPATSAGALLALAVGPSSAPPSYRPSTAWVAPSELEVDDNPASELTLGCEKGVAGNPFNFIRHRRKHAPRQEDAAMDIRTLLDKYRTFSQQSFLSDAELAARKLDAETRPRTGQVNVRISRGRPATAAMIAALSDDPSDKAPVPSPMKVGDAEVFAVD